MQPCVIPPYDLRICDSCKKEYAPRASNQRWCKTCAPSKRYVRLLQRFGISKPMLDAMLIAQGNRCALCPRTFDKNRINIDHDHDTNRIRGLLCSYCNTRLGGPAAEAWLRLALTYVTIGDPV